MGWKISKPFGGKNSVVNQIASKPAATLIGVGTGGMMGSPVMGAAIGAGITSTQAAARNASTEYQNAQNRAAAAQGSLVDQLNQMAAAEEAKRTALGQTQQQQILDFAKQQELSAADNRTKLAQSLSDQGQQTFSLANPSILEDLNARGLFTSQTARDQSQAQALKEIALANQGTLTNYDLNTQNQINDLKSSGLSAMLGGEQSAIDTALGLRQSAISQQFQNSQAQAQNALAQWLAQQQSRTQLTSSLLGLGGTLGAGALRGAF